MDDGQRNVLSGDRALGNGRGFVVGSGELRTQLTGNVAEHKDVNSIRNRVAGNTVTGHSVPFFDLLDMNPNCWRPANTWTGNTFVTKSPD